MITNNVEDQPSFNSDKFREKDENVKSYLTDAGNKRQKEMTIRHMDFWSR
jgi:hypothetical protein